MSLQKQLDATRDERDECRGSQRQQRVCRVGSCDYAARVAFRRIVYRVTRRVLDVHQQ
jgi:hypothetical protein